MSVTMTRQQSRRSGRRRFPARMARRMSGMLRHDTPFWRGAAAGLWLCACSVLALCALGWPSGFGVWFDVLTLVLAGTLAMGLAGWLAAALLSLGLPKLRLPRFFTGCAIYVLMEAWKVTDYINVDDASRWTVALAFTLSALAAAALIGFIADARVRLSVKAGTAVVLAALSLSAWYWPPTQEVPADSRATPVDAAAAEAPPLQIPDPSVPGKFGVRYFTYGSGEDKQRPEYRGDAAIHTAGVDASHYISRWQPLRTAFWGFDQHDLPLNARVWMPDRTGRYPLVLIVHGNHLMEQFSDGGYAYLGELLASRGFIAVSVDENFLNDSIWSGTPDHDMKVRAWLLLHHLRQLAAWNKQPGNPLSGAIDLERVALAGHSRGGQAAAMAADWKRWFDNDESLSGMEDIRIRAVVGIAPTDVAVDKKAAFLTDIDYLTLHGARDADVDDFYGDRQYIRTSFTRGSGHVKASLYIEDANHSRFNADWGPYDLPMPAGMLLNTRDMIAGEAGRQIVKVYVAAFLERSLHGNPVYDAVLRDYRNALSLMPDTRYWNRYESADMYRIADFDEGHDRANPGSGIKAAARGMTEWSIGYATDRNRERKGTRGTVLSWQTDAVYTLTFAKPIMEVQGAAAGTFSISLANLDRDLVTSDGLPVPIPAIAVEAADTDGDSAELPLSAFMPVEPLPRVKYAVFPYLEERIGNGRYKEEVEPVFQTYLLPLGRFTEVMPGFDPARVGRITFRFTDGPGKILLDDIGFYGD